MHYTVGVYSNGEFKTNIVRNEDLAGHIRYNKSFRIGRALFVDGICVNRGYLNDEKIQQWENIIKHMKFDLSRDTRPYK